MDTQRDKYDFKIDAFLPETLPMARLAEYLSELSRLLGNHGAVHFMKVNRGSAVLKMEVDPEAIPKVATRLTLVKQHTAPDDAMKAHRHINRMLQSDNAIGSLKREGYGIVIPFLGRETPITEDITVIEQSSLDGVVIRVGGKDNSVPVWIQSDEGDLYKCNANRSLAKELAGFLFGAPIRIHGTGKWHRTEDEHWELDAFNISSFDELDNRTLAEIAEALRAIEGNDWNKIDDPLVELQRIRGN